MTMCWKPKPKKRSTLHTLQGKKEELCALSKMGLRMGLASFPGDINWHENQAMPAVCF